MSNDEKCDFEIGALDELVRDEQVMVYKHQGNWECMDHERDVENLEQVFGMKIKRFGKNGTKSKFWENKKVFLTGHTGFKGSWMSLWLDQLNANVYGLFFKPSTSPSLFNILDLENKITVKLEMSETTNY